MFSITLCLQSTADPMRNLDGSGSFLGILIFNVNSFSKKTQTKTQKTQKTNSQTHKLRNPAHKKTPKNQNQTNQEAKEAKPRDQQLGTPMNQHSHSLQAFTSCKNPSSPTCQIYSRFASPAICASAIPSTHST